MGFYFISIYPLWLLFCFVFSRWVALFDIFGYLVVVLKGFFIWVLCFFHREVWNRRNTPRHTEEIQTMGFLDEENKRSDNLYGITLIHILSITLIQSF